MKKETLLKNRETSKRWRKENPDKSRKQQARYWEYLRECRDQLFILLELT